MLINPDSVFGVYNSTADPIMNFRIMNNHVFPIIKRVQDLSASLDGTEQYCIQSCTKHGDYELLIRIFKNDKFHISKTFEYDSYDDKYAFAVDLISTEISDNRYNGTSFINKNKFHYNPKKENAICAYDTYQIEIPNSFEYNEAYYFQMNTINKLPPEEFYKECCELLNAASDFICLRTIICVEAITEYDIHMINQVLKDMEENAEHYKQHRPD